MAKHRDIIPVLTITGSDGTGASGIQADIKTCNLHGVYVLSVMSAVTVQDTHRLQAVHPIPPAVIESQIEDIVRDVRPAVTKIGMLCDVDSVRVVSNHLHEMGHIVLDAAFVSSRGERIASPEVVEAVCTLIAPQCDIIMLKQADASLLLGCQLSDGDPFSDGTRISASAMRLMEMLRVDAVIIRGSHSSRGVQCDMLFQSDGSHYMYTLPDFSQRNTHGLAGTLSASIASNIAKGQSLTDAISSAYRFIQTLTVFSLTTDNGRTASLLGYDSVADVKGRITPRQQEVYNQLMQLLCNHLHQHHEVAFYAEQLNITVRYLTQVVMSVAGKPTKQIMDEMLVNDAVDLLDTTIMSIQEISNALGFASQAHFSKLFQRMRHMSPSAYRRQ